MKELYYSHNNILIPGSIEVKPSTGGKDNFADRVNTPSETFDYAILGKIVHKL